MAASGQLLHLKCHHALTRSPSPRPFSRTASLLLSGDGDGPSNLYRPSFGRRLAVAVATRATPGSGDRIIAAATGDGVSLGTMKLPTNIDIPRFEILLFQWANSLCQGANLPLPVPLKVDKIRGGARLGFVEFDDGKTEVRVYIDCLVSPATESSGPLFQAIRNGPKKDKVSPGEPRIMKSLLQALQKSVEIATT